MIKHPIPLLEMAFPLHWVHPQIQKYLHHPERLINLLNPYHHPINQTTINPNHPLMIKHPIPLLEMAFPLHRVHPQIQKYLHHPERLINFLNPYRHPINQTTPNPNHPSTAYHHWSKADPKSFLRLQAPPLVHYQTMESTNPIHRAYHPSSSSVLIPYRPHHWNQMHPIPHRAN